MDNLQAELEAREERLQEVIHSAQDLIKKAPRGILKIEKNKNTEQYYRRTMGNDTHGDYIRKDDVSLIHGLAQKEYEQKVLAAAQKELIKLRMYMNTHQTMMPEAIYGKISESKRKFIISHDMTDEEFALVWSQERYIAKEIERSDEDGIFTERGEQVRSKSEKILADKFFRLGIPYYYEKPLKLSGYGMVYPDFTLLNISKRKTIYWEHLGLMDNEEYCVKAIKKIETMQRNDIYQGINLILSYETEVHPLNEKFVDGLIRKFLL